MESVSVVEAKEHLEDLMRRAALGEDVVIGDAATGTVRLLPVGAPKTETEHQKPPREPGRWRGKFVVPERLFEPISEDELSWLSGEQSP